jgi:glutamyl-tRNA reductase
MVSQFRAISLSHQQAPLHVREMFALDDTQLRVFAPKLREYFGIIELFIVSTCNRTELYYVSETDLNEGLIKALAAEKGLLDHSLYLPFFEQYQAQQAVTRLFEVAAGLHSKVVGDLQIPNQIKQSYQAIADVDMAGPFVHRLLHAIFYTNKRIAQETSFRDGAASVTYIAVALAEELLAIKTKPTVLVLGLGEIGTDVCKYLSDKAFARVLVCNRTAAKAENIAANLGFEVASFENLEQNLAQADLVISSARSESPLITKEILKKQPILGYKYLIDLAVPRSVEDDIEQVNGVLLYNIDNLQAKADRALSERMEAIPAVQNIINEAVADFADWSKEVMVGPTINKLKNSLEQIRKDEIARFVKGMSQTEADNIDKITQSIIQKIIKMPVVQLKAACKRGQADGMIEAINELFDLEKQPNQQH